ncbi:MAG: aminoacyl-tRNA hydrolase [Chthonomonas sp.]|nr:aminoacyl-tRNA hydrolase [Chthonomonas sp.]
MFRRRVKEPAAQPEWLIVGLGNPGPQYSGTRHNVGFEAIDQLAERAKIRIADRRFQAVFGVGNVGGSPIMLAKPMTYMNLSGQAVAALLRHTNLTPDRLVVITDDLDLDPGRVRMKPHGGAGGHNGHRSIISSLGTDRYARIKVGIGKGDHSGRDHVLSTFTPDERALLREAMQTLCEGIEILVQQGMNHALTKVNTASNH